MKKILLVFAIFCLTLGNLIAPVALFAQNQDITCMANGKKGINTAIGCIPFENQNDMVTWLLSWGVGISGGIAFLLILYAGFMIMTSSGDPKRLQAGQELLTSAIGGVLLLIFSVFILGVIGVDILHLPGFTR